MSTYRRSFDRNFVKAPIRYAPFNESRDRVATMLNISSAGMYFEAEAPPPQGVPVYIRIAEALRNMQIEPDIGDLSDAYIAQVRWKKTRKGGVYHGVGVQFVTRCGILANIHPYETRYVCDMCGGAAETIIRETDEPVYLCIKCFKHLGGCCERVIRDNISRFLSGNVI